MSVLHACDVSCCVNPDHLFLGTRADNIADMDKKNRRIILRGEQHQSAKLTNAQVLEARASNEVSRIVAERFGCSSNLIRRIRRRIVWTHI